METSKYTAAAVVTTAGVAGAGYALWNIYKSSHKQQTLPKEWKQVGTLNDLLAYPVKSCGWVELDEAECTNMGLKVDWLRDRTLMVVDKNDNFISARAYPELLRVRPSFRGSTVTLTHPDMEDFFVDLEEVKKYKSSTAKVWSISVPVYSCGWEGSEWFSSLKMNLSDSEEPRTLVPWRCLDKLYKQIFTWKQTTVLARIGEGVVLLKSLLHHDVDSLQLVYYASNKCRPLRSASNPISNPLFHYTPQDTGAFPDETSFNLINEASIDDLNRRLKDHVVKARQFRPNFVVKGAAPFDEDRWKFVKIGDNVFEIIKPCIRCVMTTINPETAEKNSQTEPLNTLKGYRQLKDPAMRRSCGNSPAMGIQMALRSPPGGRVKINDPVFVSV